MAEYARVYAALLGSRVRAQRTYRASFAAELGASALVSLGELAEVWVIFHAVTVLGGLGFVQILLVWAIVELAFSLADLLVGHCDSLHEYVRLGTWETFYLRPVPLLLQLMASDVQLRRIGRASFGAAGLVVALVLNDIDWSLAAVALLVVTVLSATVTLSALFVWAAGVQFFLLDGAEFTNAFVYGGRYAASQPASVWGRGLLVTFGLVFPMAMVAYVPVLTLLGLPGPAWAPPWLGWCTPLAAAWTVGLAALSWRAGVRHYEGAGG